jgi:hypothetical protein
MCYILSHREALVILLMSMVNEKQPITLRCAVLYCFQCFLFKNEFGQSRLIQTLLPSTVERKYGTNFVIFSWRNMNSSDFAVLILTLQRIQYLRVSCYARDYLV